MKPLVRQQIKRKTINFSEYLSKGLSRPRTKFVENILYGIAKAKDTNVTKISRSLNENIRLAGMHKRLSRNLSDSSDLRTIENNYFDYMKKYAYDDAIVIMDDSDITKRYAKKMEYLDRVRDWPENKITD